MEWYHVTLFYSFLMTSDVGHCFICLLDNWFVFFFKFWFVKRILKNAADLVHIAPSLLLPGYVV